MKCPQAVYAHLDGNQELEESEWGLDIYMQREKWHRWVLGANVVTNNQPITLTEKTFPLRRNEVMLIMFAMRSWGFESLNDGSRIMRKRV
jgi:hypothetical protein